jgi:hypothetical protein
MDAGTLELEAALEARGPESELTTIKGLRKQQDADNSLGHWF